MSDRSFREDVERLHDYTRKRAALLRLLDEMTEDGMRAQDVETSVVSGSLTVSFCWEHSRDVRICRDKEGLDCDGEIIPQHSDPTGETAASWDRARRHRSELQAAEERLCSAAGQFYGETHSPTVSVAKQTCWIYVNHQDRKKRSDLERKVSTAVDTLHRICAEYFCTKCPRPSRHPCQRKDGNGERHTALTEKDIQKQRDQLGKVDIERNCCFCGDEPPCTKNPTTVNGNLPEPRTVGRSCYDRIRRTGKPPTRQDLDHLKKRGKWPGLRDDPSNGRSAA